MLPLPIDSYLPGIISALRSSKALILTAPPGAGKTTRIPRALYDAGFAGNGEILILEPRRLAARLAAARVAEEFGEELGKTVGYSIRFENVSSPATRIRFLTEAILARKMVRDPDLDGVSVVMLDEFHERHLATDLALAFLKRLQERKNVGLRLLLTSATMDVTPLLSYLPNVPHLAVGEPPHDLDIEYEAKADTRPLQEKTASAVLRLIRSGIEGDILVFLPGASEIRRSADALRPAMERLDVSLRMLHGDLPASDQRRALEPVGRTKVILATNVAETSITIPGVAAVVDSGLARVAGHSPWSGFQTLKTARISKSSAMQRAGRAGRTQAGRVLRLYTKQDFLSRPEYDMPEIKRADLAETALLLHGSGVRDIRSVDWLESPATSAIEAAETLLFKLGAIEGTGLLTDIGAQMLRFPLHPRLSRLIVEGQKLGIEESCALLAALLSERDIRLEVRAQLANPHAVPQKHHSGKSDLLELLERYWEAENERFEPSKVSSLGLDFRAVQTVKSSQRQLHRIISANKPRSMRHAGKEEADESILISVLSAFPDRVAKRRKRGSRELLLAEGGSAVLSSASVVHEPMFFIAVDIEEQRANSALKTNLPKIRLASAIEVDWLAGLFPEAIEQKTELVWNEGEGRVEEIRQTTFRGISLEESVRTAAPSEDAARILASAVLRSARLPFHDFSSVPEFQSRLTLVSRCFPRENWPVASEKAVQTSIDQLCAGRRSLAELSSLSLVDSLMAMLTPQQRAILRREAPERIKLGSGRTVKIHYENPEAPWIQSRLQDFLGTYSTPSICAGRISLTLHLLAPNGRAVQITRDLAGFWKNHYPSIRRELQRRYPKHAWPEPGSLQEKG
jgi:ATP-dependent helicase HrpB